MGKWLLGIFTAVMTSVLIYWLTEGINANIRRHGIAAPARAESPPPRTHARVTEDDEDRPLRRAREPRDVYSARYGTPIEPIGYAAEAYCSMTGVMGQAHDQPTPQHALLLAVQTCVYRGGIPGCCEQGARLIR